MIIVSCTKCDGWVVVVADDHDTSSAFAIAAKEEARKPNRMLTVTSDRYDQRSFGLTGACRGTSPLANKPDCAEPVDAWRPSDETTDRHYEDRRDAIESLRDEREG